MKKIDGFTGKAKKKSGDGHITYELWVNSHGVFFIKFVDNTVHTHRPGTHSDIFYSVKDYADNRDSNDSIGKPSGVDKKGAAVTPFDNNNGAFLKAVLYDLLPPRNID